MKRLLFLLFMIGSLSCELQRTTEIREHAITEKAPKKMFAGKPDLPADEHSITSIGIGKIMLGDSLNNVHALYDSVRDITSYKPKGAWPSKIIVIENNQWILAESVNSVNQITALYTNAEVFRTKQGYRIGMTLDSMNLQQDSIAIDENLKAFFLYNSGVWFKIDPLNEKKFFKGKGRDIHFLKKATIREFFIICGDC